MSSLIFSNSGIDRNTVQREATFQEDIIVYKGRGWTGPAYRHKLTHTRDPIYCYIGEHASSVRGDRVRIKMETRRTPLVAYLKWTVSRWTVRPAPRNRFRQVWELFARLPPIRLMDRPELFYNRAVLSSASWAEATTRSCSPSYRRHYIFSFAIGRAGDVTFFALFMLMHSSNTFRGISKDDFFVSEK